MLRMPLTFVLAGAALLAACNPYGPDLGEQPFRCGTSEPFCPDGYTCVMYSPSEQICQKSEGDVPDGGGGGDAPPDLTCGPNDPPSDAELEPNESITDPTITPIPDFGDDYDLVNLVICPESDIDVFRFRIDVTGKNGRVEVRYNEAQGTLLLDMLNSTGVSIRTGTPTGGDAGVLRADVTNMAQGQYFAQVKSEGGIRAGYDVSIITTTGTLPE